MSEQQVQQAQVTASPSLNARVRGGDSGRIQQENSQTAGVAPEKTLSRWLADDEAFKADYAAARRKTFEIGMGRVQAAAGRAIDTLEELLDDTDHPNVRLGAARTLAELAIHQHDADVIISKLDEIEQHNREQDNLS